MEARKRDPDLDIVRLAQARSTRRAAMGVLYERFRERVYNVSLRIVGNPEDARDVLQDVFVLLFRKIHRFRAQSRFAAWIYRVTVNVSLDRLRRRRQQRLLAAGPDLIDLQPDIHRTSSPEHGAASRDLERHVQAALHTLSDRLRVVAVLRYLEGLSYEEIAEVLDCSLGTVKSRLNRAHTRIKSYLNPMYAPGSDPELHLWE